MTSRRRCLQGLLAVAASTRSMPAHAQDLGRFDLQWTDAARQRTLPLRLRLPAGEQPAALVLFSHGLGGSVDAGTNWARAWAAAGVATLHLQHPGSDSTVLRSGLRALRSAANAQQLLARVADVRFVLDELQRRRDAGEAMLARLRPDAIGMAGHSFGAHTTLAVAGQRYGSPLAGTVADPRPRAFAAFSPSPGSGRRADPAASFGGITRPVLCLTGSLDADPLSQGSAEESDDRASGGRWRRAVYDALPAGAKAELWLEGADHMTFSGQDAAAEARRWRSRAPAASAQAARHRALIESVSAAWWRWQLLGDSSARASLQATPAGLGTADAWRTG